jgi:hypothetical protein
VCWKLRDVDSRHEVSLSATTRCPAAPATPPRSCAAR